MLLLISMCIADSAAIRPRPSNFYDRWIAHLSNKKRRRKNKIKKRKFTFYLPGCFRDFRVSYLQCSSFSFQR